MSIEQKIIEAIQSRSQKQSRRFMFGRAAAVSAVTVAAPFNVFGQSYPNFPQRQSYDMRPGLHETMTAIDNALRPGGTLNVVVLYEHRSIAQLAFEIMLLSRAQARYGNNLFYGYEVPHTWPVQYLNTFKQRLNLPTSMSQPVSQDWVRRYDPHGIETMKMLSTFAGPPNALFSNYTLRSNIIRQGIRSRPIDGARDRNMMLDLSDPQTREAAKKMVGLVSPNQSGASNDEMPSIGVVIRNRVMADLLVQNPARIRIVTVGAVHGYERIDYGRPYAHSLPSFLEASGERVLCVGLEQNAMPPSTRITQNNLVLPSGIPIAYVNRIPESEDRMLNRIFSASGASQLFVPNAAACPYGEEMRTKLPQWLGLPQGATLSPLGCK